MPSWHAQGRLYFLEFIYGRGADRDYNEICPTNKFKNAKIGQFHTLPANNMKNSIYIYPYLQDLINVNCYERNVAFFFLLAVVDGVVQ
jgi:hypothetical protein